MTTNALHRSVHFRSLVLSTLLLLATTLSAQQEAVEEGASGQETAPPPAPTCTDSDYRQFDFWIGDWEVTSNGQVAGTNHIHPILGGCALQENWQGAGPGGVSGTSFNIYDQAHGRWHQTWVDSSGTLLLLDGGMVDGKMVLTGERPRRDGNGSALHRITWTPNDDGSVTQYWEATSDGGETWNVLFDGLYTPRGDNP
jgi:hypothetical protein